MAKVHITNVVVLDNPSSFSNPFQFELTFECIEELKEDLEWKMIYVGSAESEDYDQVLDTIYVGPVPEGRHIFVFQAEPPDVTKIPEQDAVGVTVVLLTCCYRGQEFVRVGYFINVDYSDPELRENPPTKPQFDKMTRNILATKPRVTRFKINWDDTSTNGLDGEMMGAEGSCSTDMFQIPQSQLAQAELQQMQENPHMMMMAPDEDANGLMEEDNSMALPGATCASSLNENSISMEC